jgi:lysozyme
LKDCLKPVRGPFENRIKRWLIAVEAHYKVKPIIYTGERYYDDFLKEEFSDYLFWIAIIIFIGKICRKSGFGNSRKASVSGIKGNVDVNIYNGDLQQ